MILRKFSFSLSALLLTLGAQAFEPFVIEDIQVNGLLRINEGTVLNYMPLHVGDVLSSENSTEVIRALYETGFFKNIELDHKEKTLILNLTERRSIGHLSVSGNKEIKTDKLMEVLQDIGLTEGRTFNQATLEQMRNELEQMYFSHGYYGVQVKMTVADVPRNRVSIDIDVEEGKVAKIARINLIGNHEFKANTLLSQFSLSKTNLLSIIKKDDQYGKQKLYQDLESLRTFYLDHGYLNFQILSTQVSITPDKSEIYITINLIEGESYRLSSVRLAGDLILPESEFLPIVEPLKIGQVFSRAQMADVVSALKDRLGEEGYAFSEIEPIPEVDEEAHTVGITFFFQPGERIYVRHILFDGNAKTQDEVLRREMTQFEHTWYSTKKVEDSKRNLDRTGYFDSASVTHEKVPGYTDYVDLRYEVEEASAGQLEGGVGYSDQDGLLFNASVQNRNFMGTGKSADFRFNKSQVYTTYSIGYDDPYFTMDGVSAGFGLYYSKTNLSSKTRVSEYTTDAIGGNLNFGVPISENQRLSFGLGYQNTRLTFGDEDDISTVIKKFVADYGEQFDEYTGSLGWQYNSFDRFLFPTKGLRLGGNASLTMPPSDLTYYLLSASTKWYQPISRGFILSVSTRFGYGDGYGSTESLPFYKHFYAGGARTVRGFSESSLGPRDSEDRALGGNFLGTASVGLVVPNFFAPDLNSVRVSLFLDVGQSYDLYHARHITQDDKVQDLVRNSAGVRWSTGVSVTWMSPLGPLVFNLSTPLNHRAGDKLQRFSFSMGTNF